MKQRNSKGIENFIYLHPREIDENQEKIQLKALEHFIHYHGLSTCEQKLETLIKDFSSSFITCKDFSELKH